MKLHGKGDQLIHSLRLTPKITRTVESPGGNIRSVILYQTGSVQSPVEEPEFGRDNPKIHCTEDK